MTELLAAADVAIAHATGAEAGTVTHCAASAITVLCAGAMTGTHLGKVLALPDTSRMQNEVIIQKRHTVGFGAPVTQMIHLSGAKAVEFGEANRALPEQMEFAITDHTAAAAVRYFSHDGYQRTTLAAGICRDCPPPQRSCDCRRRCRGVLCPPPAGAGC